MASKTISLLLIATCIIQIIYAKCPHRNFEMKHLLIVNLRHDQSNMVKIGKFAARMAPQRMVRPDKQTIYVLTEGEKSQMTTDGNHCLWTTTKPKVTCEWKPYQKEKYDCNEIGQGNAYHTGSLKNNKLICPADINAVSTPFVFENYSTRQQLNDFAEQNRQYQLDGRKVFAVTGNAEWIKNESVNSCKLKVFGIEFRCEKYWQCKQDGRGNGRHRISDGHLE